MTAGRTYKVKMRARYYNADRSVHEWSGPWTSVVKLRVIGSRPGPPSGLTVSEVSYDRLTLSWDRPEETNVTGYPILRGPDADNLSALVNDTGSADPGHTDNTAEAETTYTYAVLALSPDGDSPQSTISVTTKAAPKPPKRTPPPTREIAPRSTDVTLVSNLGKSGTNRATMTSAAHGQAFTTGAGEHGFTVTSVSIKSDDSEGDAITLRVCPTDGGATPKPTLASCTSLTPPGAFPAGNDLLFQVPSGTTLTLAANTTYMVVFGGSSGNILLDATNTTDEDSTSLSGWSIRDRFQYEDGENWTQASYAAVLLIKVTGRENPPPGPPTSADGTIVLLEDGRYGFKSADFSYSDPDSQPLDHVVITEFPSRGKLKLGGQEGKSFGPGRPGTTQSSKVPANRIGRLVYEPPDDANGQPYTSFKFKVNDGTHDSASAYTMTINVPPVNDPAYGSPAVRGVEQVGHTLSALTLLSIGDPDGVPPADQFGYQWKRYAADGTTFEADVGTNRTYTLTSADRGKEVKLAVSFTDRQGNREGPRLSPPVPYLPGQTIGQATLASNMAVGGSSSINFIGTTELRQDFVVGSSTNGHNVKRVIVKSEDSQGDDISVQICELDQTGTPCTALTAPMTFPRGNLSFDADNFSLETGRRYSVVIKSPGGEHLNLAGTWSQAFDSSSLETEVRFIGRSQTGSVSLGTWSNYSKNNRPRIAVLGTINE